MSEEILKALTQLFAIITKQDEGVTEVERLFVEKFFKQRLSKDSVDEYLALYEEFLVDKKKKRRSSGSDDDSDEGSTSISERPERATRLEKADRPERPARPERADRPERLPRPERLEKPDREKNENLTSMKDSVRTLAICKKINKTLAQKQKVIVLIELLELVNVDKNFSPQREQIINTVSEVFNIQSEEYEIIEKFVMGDDPLALDHSNVLIAAHDETGHKNSHYIHSKNLDGALVLLKINSVDLYFIKYLGVDEISLNSQVLPPSRVLLFSHGSTIKLAKDAPIYYSDVVGHYQTPGEVVNITFNVKNLEFTFPNGHVGLRDVNITEDRGKLIGIMGASGAGKTTLLNCLAGIETPSSGEVLINGINIHSQKDEIQGVIGYITQDDILIEDLTVFENLYYNAKLCFKDSTEEEIIQRVDTTLESLGLLHIKSLKVGNVLNKKISGGQRKRLNIALELIREPAVMFVDEPTSGLSSRDSENVIGLLKELSLKGKLIFVVIHQPSSDIYKMFDKMFIMDTGGYPIYYGHPVEGLIYFKTASNQINSEKGQCSECGNVNPELLFDIVESQVVNEYGQLTNKRKVSPLQWSGLYKENFNIIHVSDNKEAPPSSLKIPSKVKQWIIYMARDFKSKSGNMQYLLINILEAPFLALLLALIIRYTNSPDGESYLFRYNENVPAYILMSIVVALFMGLTVSAEEIIRDRKVLRRERFLNLSNSSYLLSKIGLLFSLSALQTFMFVMIGNSILGIEGMYLQYWLVLFSISCFANVLGLNISASFNEAVTVYIVIPLLLIPQMVLSGALFSFDKLNEIISAKDKVPLIADVMASRWAYEGLAVEQASNNNYTKNFFVVDKEKSEFNFQKAYLLPEIVTLMNQVIEGKLTDEVENVKLSIIKSEVYLLANQYAQVPLGNILDFDQSNFSDKNVKLIKEYFSKLEVVINESYTARIIEKDNMSKIFATMQKARGVEVADIQNNNYNETLDDLVKNISVKNRIIEYNGALLQRIDPIYKSPNPSNIMDYRTHFYAPSKNLFGTNVSTLTFNILVIWFMTVFLYLTLYFELFRKVIEGIGNMKLFNKEA